MVTGKGMLLSGQQRDTYGPVMLDVIEIGRAHV